MQTTAYSGGMSDIERRDHYATMHRVKMMKRWMWVMGVLTVVALVVGGLALADAEYLRTQINDRIKAVRTAIGQLPSGNESSSATSSSASIAPTGNDSVNYSGTALDASSGWSAESISCASSGSYTVTADTQTSCRYANDLMYAIQTSSQANGTLPQTVNINQNQNPWTCTHFTDSHAVTCIQGDVGGPTVAFQNG